jgi:hypothetical protein
MSDTEAVHEMLFPSRRVTRSRSRVEIGDRSPATLESINTRPEQDVLADKNAAEVAAQKISTVAFEVNKPLKLESFRRDELLEFVRKYKLYVEGFKDQGADQMQPKSLKTMIKPSMLRTICRYKLKVAETNVRSSEIYQ